MDPGHRLNVEKGVQPAHRPGDGRIGQQASSPDIVGFTLERRLQGWEPDSGRENAALPRESGSPGFF
jgi:hypothetical protein